MTATRSILAGVVAAMLAVPGAQAQRSLFDTPAPSSAPAPTAPAPAPAPQAAGTDAPASKPKPKKRAAPRGPVPARVIAINNASANTLTSLTVEQAGKSAELKKPLPAKKKTSLKLPAFRECTVSVASTFEGQPAETSELDICKEKSVRFTE